MLTDKSYKHGTVMIDVTHWLYVNNKGELTWQFSDGSEVKINAIASTISFFYSFNGSQFLPMPNQDAPENNLIFITSDE